VRARGGADYAPIEASGLCYLPNTLAAHASYAFNSIFQRSRAAPGACDFAGTATVTLTDTGQYYHDFPRCLLRDLPVCCRICAASIRLRRPPLAFAFVVGLILEYVVLCLFCFAQPDSAELPVAFSCFPGLLS
jgi:hypothetical protein